MSAHTAIKKLVADLEKKQTNKPLQTKVKGWAGMAQKLTYMRTPREESASETLIKEVEVESVPAEYLARVGQARFDAVIVRNMNFVVSVVRMMRERVRIELEKSREIVVSEASGVSRRSTQYTQNESFETIHRLQASAWTDGPLE
jgi:hypothetical protein